MANHTPGPWTVSLDGFEVLHKVDEETWDHVAKALPNDDAYPEGTTEANAQLIAAAPDLLIALEAIAACQDEGERPTVLDWTAVRAAIAKARGA